MDASDDNEVKTNVKTYPTSNESKLQELDKSKKKKERKQNTKVRQIFSAIFSRDAFLLLLSHHPFCEVYDSHVFKIGKLRLCRGCFLSYPPLYALPAIFVFWEAAREFFLNEAVSIIDNLWWFVIGFGILAGVGRWLGRYSIFIKDLAKFGRGAWAGFLLIVLFSSVKT